MYLYYAIVILNALSNPRIMRISHFETLALSSSFKTPPHDGRQWAVRHADGQNLQNHERFGRGIHGRRIK